LVFYRRLASEAPRFLRADGRLMAEFGDGQAEPVAQLFTERNWVVERIEPDYAGRARRLVAALKD
jgi:methylase of polypeptide subunit release factors